MPAFPDVSALSSGIDRLRAQGAALFGQNARLLRLRFAESSEIGDDVLLPHRLHGEEGLSAGYRYVLECLSPDANVELKTLLGQPAEIGLLLPDGGERLFTGLVTRAEQHGADGGFARYTLTLEPALATLAHRRNSRVFQDKTVIDIVAAVLAEHRSANPAFARGFAWRDDTVKTYPQRSYCLQYRETDLAFLERLLAEEGIAYRYVHGRGEDERGSKGSAGSGATSLRAPDAPPDDTVPQHTLILFDDNTVLPVLTPESPIGRTGTTVPQALRFHRTAGVESDDALDVWHGTRQLQSGQTTLLAWDYQSVAAHLGGGAAATFQGAVGDPLSAGLEDYDPQTLYYGSDPTEMERYAALRQAARDRAAKTFTGEGSVRRLMAGGWFPLADHPIHDADPEEDRQFLVTKLSFAAQNNLLPDDPLPENSLLTHQETPYRARIEAIRKHIPYVPDYTRTAHQKPTAPGGTTATVVGPVGEEIHTDEHGRIKLQFHWQRPQDHPDGGADLDERSSTWVRVAYPSAGAAWGSQYIPRIGQEVLVSFLEGDIDRPVVSGVLYNGTHRPPEFSAAGRLPANKTLSGHKSKEYKGQGWNELVFDDSTGQLRTRLSSEHGTTQLNQGYLIHPRTDGKGEARGEGFELRTDKHGAIRAGQGLFITTEAQAKASGKQLTRDHAHSQLEAAYQLTQSLAEVATKQAADTLEHGPETIAPDNTKQTATHAGHLQHHVEAVKAWEAGTNTDPDGKTAKDEPGRQPILILSAPAGIAAATGQNLSLSAGTNLDFTAQRDTNQTSGRRWLHNVGQHLNLFVNGVKDTLAMKLIAAQGKVQVQAQHGAVEVTSEKNQDITSTTRKIRFAAGQEVLLTSGGAYVRIKDGNIELHCPGTLSVKGAKRVLSGGAGMTIPPVKFGETTPPLQLNYHYDDLEPIAGAPYKVTFANGDVRQGVLDKNGYAEIPNPPAWEYLVEYGEDPRPYVPSDETEDKSYLDTAEQQRLVARMRKEAGIEGDNA